VSIVFVIRTSKDNTLSAAKEPTAGFKFTSISNLAEAYRSGSITPLAVAEAVLHGIQNSDEGPKPLRSIVQCNKQAVIAMAQKSTSRLANNTPLSLLDGIPVAVKEELAVVPYHLHVGTTFLGEVPAESDATVVRKLKEAGAVIIGISNMHELGIGTTGCNPNKLHGICRNPYDVDHYAGGSSSGSAVAVAAGLVPVAIGADGGGSIRIPASMCGVVGLKEIKCHNVERL
jgi:Asp-tRNA(Asn)/Glu-tRNA(Gln) amidotransferase A subunit family amidase